MDSSPVVLLMLNLAASAPPLMLKVTVSRSASAAVTVVTVVVFSVNISSSGCAAAIGRDDRGVVDRGVPDLERNVLAAGPVAPFTSIIVPPA